MAVALLLATLATPFTQADWMQPGANAQQHGYASGGGPVLNETAFQIRLPTNRPFRAGPVILDRTVYVLAEAAPPAKEPSLLAVNLDTTRYETARTVAPGAQSLAAGQGHLYVLGRSGLDAYPYDRDAEPIHFDPPRGTATASEVECAEPLPQGDHVYLACILHPKSASSMPGGLPVDEHDVPSLPELVVERLNLSRRTRDWTHTRQAPSEGQPAHTGSASYVVGLAADDGHVYVTTQETAGTSGALQAYVYALRSSNGGLHWQRDSRRETNARQPENATASSVWNFAVPVAAEGLVFLKFHDLQFVDPEKGTVVWRDSLRLGDPQAFDRGSGLAYHDGILYAAAQRTISAYDVARRTLMWRTGQERLGPGEEFHTGGLMVTDGFLYARASLLESPPDEADTHVRHDTLYAFELRGRETPQVAWARRLVPQMDFHEQTGQVAAFRLGVDQGILVAHGVDGTLTSLGRTGASIQIELPPAPHNPAPGAEVALDLSATRPGLLGSGPGDLEFAARWGDEDRPRDLSWNASPILKHRYGIAADYHAEIYARNSAGQFSILPITFEVGRPSPPHLNFLQRVFSNENQDRTFFMLGLLITGSGSVLGVARIRHRRNLLHRELRSIEDAYLLTNHIPVECETALGERKTHLRALLLDNRITETQYSVLDRRVEELRSAVRLNSLEDKFDFMPVSLMKRLQRILRDGHITRAEYEEFLGSLRRERSMSPAEKNKVKVLVERWFARDSVSL